jgi:N,N'-diacetyllegionaminate synthase
MNTRILLIAEAGVNHNGDVALARQLVDLAAEAGADFVKFQTWVTDELVDARAPKAEYQKTNDGDGTSQYEMLKRLELSFEDFMALKSYCTTRGIGFLSTPDDEKSLDFLVDKLHLDLIKIGSGEITNIPYLRKVGKKGRDVIMSTGMASLGEVERAYAALTESGARSVALLHCTSDYPADFDSINLGAMITLKSAFKTRVGYSDHSEGIAVSVAAVALGAEIVEKHFTLDRNLPGPDHLASMGPEETRAWVRSIRQVERALAGSGKKEMQASEAGTRSVVLKGIYLRKPVSAGTVISEDLLAFKRPRIDLSADQIDLVLGKRIRMDLPEGTPLALKHIDFE